MSLRHAPNETRGPRTIGDVVPLERHPTTFRARSQIAAFVEVPLLRACELFFDKGIITIESSTSHSLVPQTLSWIQLEYETLSPSNREIGRRIGTYTLDRRGLVIDLEYPTTPATLVETVSDHFVNLANQFERQEAVQKYFTREEAMYWASYQTKMKPINLGEKTFLIESNERWSAEDLLAMDLEEFTTRFHLSYDEHSRTFQRVPQEDEP